MAENTDENSLEANNLLKKIKLQNEFGMQMDSSSLPPEAESEWLDYIISFEEKHKNAQSITIYEFIGKPEYKPLAEIPVDEIATELDNLLEIMYQNQVALETICEVEAEVLYQFIVEELFQEEITDIRIEGMMHSFIYEEYHPNHEYDLRHYTEDYLEHNLLTEGREFIKHGLSQEFIKTNGQAIEDTEAEKIILAYKNAHKSFKINQLDIFEIDFSLESKLAYTKFRLDYEALNAETEDKLSYRGEGRFGFEYSYDSWSIYQIQIPGFVI